MEEDTLARLQLIVKLNDPMPFMAGVLSTGLTGAEKSL